MASIYPRKMKGTRNGKESIVWYVGWYQNGQHRSKSVGPSKTVAEKVRRQIEAELVSDRFDFLNRPDDVPIETSLDAYLEHVQSLRKSTTATRYRDALGHVRRFFREKLPTVTTVSRLTQAHFTEYQQWRRSATTTTANGRTTGKKKPPAFRTINNELKTGRSWLNWAKTMGQIRENPLTGLKALKTTDSKQACTLTRDEFSALLEASLEIEKSRPARKGQTDLWRFLGNTGMRVGELTHLEWSDIDFRRGVIKIQRKPDWDPKTYEREIPFTLESAAVLQKRRDQAAMRGLVFRFRSGRPLRESTIRTWLLDCAKKAGINGMRGPHDLRHTFITMALTEFGIDVPTVQKVVGHRNLETTQAYLHPTTEHIKTAIGKFGM